MRNVLYCLISDSSNDDKLLKTKPKTCQVLEGRLFFSVTKVELMPKASSAKVSVMITMVTLVQMTPPIYWG